jgi:hypothetical protein
MEEEVRWKRMQEAVSDTMRHLFGSLSAIILVQ